ncbi:hypothetical protein V2J09_013668 [Rumex salicifolius]
MTMSNVQGQFGDTTLTKVFVGGLAWETPMETLRDYFVQFGDILEAVVISDKLSGRSKGYGFVTFKEAEAAKKACEEATPIINGRRANCNLAAQGARRQKTMSRTPTPPLQQGNNVNNNVGMGMGMGGKSGGIAVVGPPASQVQWYFPVGVPPAVSPFHHQHPQVVPVYGYSPAYVAADYNQNSRMYRGVQRSGILPTADVHRSGGRARHDSRGGRKRIHSNVHPPAPPPATALPPAAPPPPSTDNGPPGPYVPRFHCRPIYPYWPICPNLQAHSSSYLRSDMTKNSWRVWRWLKEHNLKHHHQQQRSRTCF